MFAEAWNQFFQDIPMIGRMLRDSKPDLWFRIHSLPESKRYPDSKLE